MDQPRLVTVAIITHEDQFLLIRRGREPFKEEWAFIGGCGAFKKTPDPIQAVKEEVVADIKCQFEPTFLCYQYETIHVPSLVFYFHGTIKGTPVMDPRYVSEWKWVTKQELEHTPLAFNQNSIIDQFLLHKPHKAL